MKAPRGHGPVASWRRRFQHAVKERFLVRFHMALILTGVTVVGMIANRVMFLLGIGPMALRYPLAVLLAYLAFFAGVWIWIAYIRSEAPEPLQEPALAAAVTASAAAALVANAPPGSQLAPGVTLQDVADAADVGGSTLGSIGDIGGGGDEGMGYVLVAALVLAVLIAGAWLVWQAPIILTEAAFSAMLAGAVRRAAKGGEGPSWAWAVFKRTVIPFAVVALVAAGVGFGAHLACPRALTLHWALNCKDIPAERVSR
jgi:hypothetical protein